MENILFLIFDWPKHFNGYCFLCQPINSSIPNFMQYAADHNIMEEILVCTARPRDTRPRGVRTLEIHGF